MERMKVITSLDQLEEPLPYPVMAIGVFDGVHLGHQRIIRTVVAQAEKMNGTPILLSFDPHPQKVIASGEAPALIQTFPQRAEILETLGIRVFIRCPFTRQLSLLSPAEFVQEVICSHGIREIHVGDNFRFGHRRSGDFNTLLSLAAFHRFDVFKTERVLFRNERVSSTRIRRILTQGQVAVAKRLLGRPYQIRGTVVQGARKGGQFGFPTANLATENELIPRVGVYATRASVNGRSYPAATNIGFRPTIHGYSEPKSTIEAHLLDFSGDLYGQDLSIDFCLRLRDEKKFDGLDELLRQIKMDIHRLKWYAERAAEILEN
jgi:riboflavin kinase/FMN adenylyltransferase